MLTQAQKELPIALQMLLPVVGSVPRNLVALFKAAARTCQEHVSSDSGYLGSNALDVAALTKWLQLSFDALQQGR